MNTIMSFYQKRTRNVFNPNSDIPYKLSRSKIELFLNCPRCFYLDRRLGISQPSSPPFTLNNAVDKLLKKEFDIHRAKGTSHPLMKTYGIEAVPFQHEKMNEWRDALGSGIQYLHQPTNLIISGGIDDLWVNAKNELIIVDYKATAKETEVNLDADWQISYKRQMEIYQWLFRQNGFKVNPVSYFVYCNGDTDKEAFDGKLEFNIKIIPYQGNDRWVENAISEIKKCLLSNIIPQPALQCQWCLYRLAASAAEKY